MIAASSFSYLILLYGMITGVILYDYIDVNLNFSYNDEIFVLALLLQYVFLSLGTYKINRSFLLFIYVSLLYLFYSLLLQVNDVESVLIDFFLFSKSFVAFYCALKLPLNFSGKQAYFIRLITLFFAVCVLLIGLKGSDAIIVVFGHPSRYATVCIILGLQYLIFSERKKVDVILSLLIISVGLLSLKAKIFVFFPLVAGIFLLGKVRLADARVYIVLFFMLLVAGYLGWDKFYFYFIEGVKNPNDLFARPALYIGAGHVLIDYFPLGSGFGSYGSYGAAVNYSPLYYQYGLNEVYGLDVGGPFLHDAFLPQLAQFGIVGVFLFSAFWFDVWKRIGKIYLLGSRDMGYRLAIVILLFFLVESPVDSTFVQNRGVYMMILLAILLKKDSGDFIPSSKAVLIGHKKYER